MFIKTKNLGWCWLWTIFSLKKWSVLSLVHTFQTGNNKIHNHKSSFVDVCFDPSGQPWLSSRHTLKAVREYLNIHLRYFLHYFLLLVLDMNKSTLTSISFSFWPYTLYTTFCVTQANPTTDALPLDNDKQKILETNFKVRFKAVLYMLCVMHSHCWGYHYSTVKYLPSAAWRTCFVSSVFQELVVA